MDTLPEELMLGILDLLEDSISSFSLVCRTWAAIAKPYRLRVATITFSSPETLSDAVTKAKNFLDGNFRHVRHLRVLAANLYSLEDGASFTRLRGKVDKPLLSWKYTAVDQSRSQLLQDDRDWRCLIDLIGELPINELTWRCVEQLPRSILRHLHTRRPPVHLNMLNWDLRSLCSASQPIKMSAEDMELATSPCLRSITLMIDNSSGLNDHNLAAVNEMIAGGAPGLKNVSICWHFGGSTFANVLDSRLPRQRWQSGTIHAPSDCPKGRLESIKLLGYSGTNTIEEFGNLTDFATLRSLDLLQGLEGEAFERLAAGRKFAKIEQLTLALSPQTLSAAQLFILSLPPLSRLRLYDDCDATILYSIADHCGQSLRQLYCMEVFWTEILAARLLESCRYIEDLRVSIRRQEGRNAEVTLYKSLGRFTRLRKLELGMHSHQDIADSSIESGIQTPPPSIDLENAMLFMKNIAIDRNLARSIYEAICSTKASDSRSLDSLTLKMEALGNESGAFSEPPFIRLLWYVGHSWLCTRNDSGMQQCDVQCYDPAEEVEYRQWAEEDGELDEALQTPYALAIHQLWPRSRYEPFKDAWHSFPLVGLSKDA